MGIGESPAKDGDEFCTFCPNVQCWRDRPPNNLLSLEGSSKKTVLFGTIDPNVGGWGRVNPNFLQITVFIAYLTPFCRKFPVNSR